MARHQPVAVVHPRTHGGVPRENPLTMKAPKMERELIASRTAQERSQEDPTHIEVAAVYREPSEDEDRLAFEDRPDKDG